MMNYMEEQAPTILWRSCNDKLYGDSSNDYLKGHAGEDCLYGGTGKDYLRGGDDNDKLYGEKVPTDFMEKMEMII